MKHEINPIGIIHSPYKTKKECPIQRVTACHGKGTVELFPEYEKGLKDIDLFSHVILLYLFDRAGEVQLIRHPFLDDTAHGIFASRHPCRPNGIGLSIVQIDGVNGNRIDVSGIDVLDGTPLVDVKPYVPKFDYVDGASNGWVESKPFRPKPEGRE